MRKANGLGGALALAISLLLGAAPAGADVASDRAASILVYPKIVVDSGQGVDTLIQLSNTSQSLVQLHCFYIDATSHCSISGVACDPEDPEPCPNSADLCLPGWQEVDFRVFVTAEQPLGWVASRGLADDLLPLDGRFLVGPTGESNVGTRIPPVSEDPFIGELKCIVTDENGRAIARNVIKGEATITRTAFDITKGGPDEVEIDVAKYNAIGIQGIEGDSNGDNMLVLGSNEYNGCPNILVMDHFFDFAVNPAAPTGNAVASRLTLVPCQQDLLNQVPGGTTVQYLVFNEFEQRFSTSRPMQCLFDSALSRIDTRNPLRSIFSVYVAGTLTGQTRIRGVSAGLLGILTETLATSADGSIARARTAAVNLHKQGVREQPDQIVLP
ncbi:MAG: hypothetical protein KatS3mg076_2326 [Candidatus Binatia bacterium]|nr:MAG: hypothetical protein KatS3mg076_2326 [Candidatus Binatia bacterium]